MFTFCSRKRCQTESHFQPSYVVILECTFRLLEHKIKLFMMHITFNRKLPNNFIIRIYNDFIKSYIAADISSKFINQNLTNLHDFQLYLCVCSLLSHVNSDIFIPAAMSSNFFMVTRIFFHK